MFKKAARTISEKWIQGQAQVDETSFYRWTFAIAAWNFHIKVKSSNLPFRNIVEEAGQSEWFAKENSIL